MKDGKWPDGTYVGQGSAVMLSSEDAIDDTVRPRLEAAGADVTRVRVVRMVRTKDGDRSFSLQDDLAKLRELIIELGDVKLVSLDPITSYMGTSKSIDSYRVTDVRAVLEPLARLADEMRVAVLAITHPNKYAKNALDAFGGSGAFVHVPRLAFFAIEEPENLSRYLLLPVKRNIGKKGAGIGYSIEGVDLKSGINAPLIKWDRLAVEVTADEALRAENSSETPSKIDAAATFLEEYLGKGEKKSQDVELAAMDKGISERTLKRARRKLGIKSLKDGFSAGWKWRLP
jgi:RecA-family ATPase